MDQLSGNNKVLAIYEDKFLKRISLAKFNEMPRKAMQKENEKKKSFKYVFNKIRLKKCASAAISKPLSTYHVAYLGNVVTGWAKGEGCIEKPLTTLWRNYIQSSRPDVNMHLTISGGGLKAVTKNHGLTEYWAHRLTTCSAPQQFPRIICWVYRHEVRRLRQELRCHAALCSSSEMALQIEKELKEFLSQALTDFKKDKLSRQNARLSLVNSVNENPSLPRRKILLGIGSHNYKPPLECSKSAPKLSSIEEIFGEEEEDNIMLNNSEQIYKNILKSYERINLPFDKSFKNKASQVKQWHENRKTGDTKLINTNNKNIGFKDSVSNINEQIIIRETEGENCDKLACLHQKCPLGAVDEDNKDKSMDSDIKVDLDFKIGGEVLPAIKALEKLSNIDHSFVSPIINKAFMDQEQVSLVPVGETHADFSSLKVYKKRSLPEGHKDFSACAMFLGESISQLENIFQAHCTFNGDRPEEDLPNKINSTLLV